MTPALFNTEAEMVAYWIEGLDARAREVWTIYPETAGWDLLLVHRDGYQVGIEAKLSLNAKVVAQALEGQHRSYRAGPDYRAVLVPLPGLQNSMTPICQALGIAVIPVYLRTPHVIYSVSLPDEADHWRNSDAWPNWCPTERCPLPDYVPDVTAGVPSPLALTEWKIKAIKLMIILDKRGWVERNDMRMLKISETRWCDRYQGMLTADGGGRGRYVRCDATPDLRAMHPVNYPEIEADFPNWGEKWAGEPWAAWMEKTA